jgi:hypothetical protein
VYLPTLVRQLSGTHPQRAVSRLCAIVRVKRTHVDGHMHRKRRRTDRIAATTTIFGREEKEKKGRRIFSTRARGKVDALITRYEILLETEIYVTVMPN